MLGSMTMEVTRLWCPVVHISQFSSLEPYFRNTYKKKSIKKIQIKKIKDLYIFTLYLQRVTHKK